MRCLPTEAVLNDLRAQLPQRWLDGYQSIVDPRFCEGKERFPFYILEFWVQVKETAKQRLDWQRAEGFLAKEMRKGHDSKTMDVLSTAWGLFDRIGWRERFPTYRVYSMDLTMFLGHGWLSDTQIDLMAGHINLRLEHEGTKYGRRSSVASLAFANKIVSPEIWKTWENGKPQDRVMQHFKSLILEDEIEVLYIPVHVNNNHWITMVVDFGQKEIYYGRCDSLASSSYTTTPPRQFFQKLKLWLLKRLKLDMAEKGRKLETGLQKDTYNCGICFGSSVLHNAFGEPSWSADAALRHRVAWFNRLSGDLISVSGVSQTPENPDPAVNSNRLTLSDLMNPVASTTVASTITATFAHHSDTDSDIDSCLGSTSRANLNVPTTATNGDRALSESSNDNFFLFPTEPSSEVFNQYSDREDSAPSTPSSALPDSSFISDANTSGRPLSPFHDIEMMSGPPTSNNSIKSASSKVSSTPSKIYGVMDKVKQKLSPKRSRDPGSASDGLTPPKPQSSPTSNAFSALTSSILERKRGCRSPTVSTTESESEPVSKKRGVGKSRSAIHATKVRKAQKNGTLAIDNDRLIQWKQEIQKLDPAAVCKDDAVAYHCSRCLKRHKVKQAYDLTRVRDHMKKCKPAVHGGRMTDFFSKNIRSKKSPKPLLKASEAPNTTTQPPNRVPCPGLSQAYNSHIGDYLHRTPVAGRGGQDIRKLAKTQYGKSYGDLSPQEKALIVDEQERSHTWENRHELDPPRVFSRRCLREVPETPPLSPQPCTKCAAVYISRTFKNALNHKLPNESKLKHTNKRFRADVVTEISMRILGMKEVLTPDAKKPPHLHYAMGALRGEYSDEVFDGLTQSYLMKHDKQSRGVGLQNFKYAPAYNKFCHLLFIRSPAAYRMFREQLPARTERSFREKEARQPRFPMEICERTYQLAVEHLTGLMYHGPVGLSCDDTKLFSTLRLYWDSEKKSHFLIGAVEGPLAVQDPEGVRTVIEGAKFQKANKLRLWCLCPEVPGSTPIVLHAMPIGTGFDAPKLELYSRQLIRGLVAHGIQVISYACDGTEVERAVQALLLKNSDSQLTYEIPSPQTIGATIIIEIAVFGGQPVAMVQDSKHGAKTFQNNLFSGARLLVIGSHCAYYAQIHELAQGEDSPLFNRDVEKLDRQDDNAATRLFSAGLLRYLVHTHPEWAGTIVYLFVFGEVVDAYQNRHIDHTQRVTMILRARYFLDLWATFLECSGYANASYPYCTHRDHLPGNPVPFLPWLHSSEACEHAFGICRQIIKDFSYADFIYMIPKLRVSVRQAILKLRTQLPDGKARASGYCHTYFHAGKLDPLVLSSFPSDEQIFECATTAFAEAESLLMAVGVDPKVLGRLQSFRNGSAPALPSYSDWAPIDDTLWDSDGESDNEDDKESESQQVQDLIAQLDSDEIQNTASRHQAERITSLTYAAVVLDVEDDIQVQRFADQSSSDVDIGGAVVNVGSELTDGERCEVENYLSCTTAGSRELPTIKPIVTTPNIFGCQGVLVSSPGSFNWDAIISMRQDHQTEQAVTGLRTPGRDSKEGSDSTDNQLKKKSSPRVKLIKAMNDVLKETREQGLTTGVGRSVRTKALSTKESAPPANSSLAAGNSANAAVVAANDAKAAARKRTEVFTNAKLPHLSSLITAKISDFKPLHEGDWVLVAEDKKIYLAKVLPVYSKSSAKGAKHDAVLDGKGSISAFSNVGVQLFEHVAHEMAFTPCPESTIILQTRAYAILPSIHVLVWVKQPTLSLSGSLISHRATLVAEDYQVFTDLQLHSKNVFIAIEAFKQKQHKSRKKAT
ncbi:hypothetical protein PM082_002377 [Marasmius tenuissimus]|nr:hypothetical protein PM082_002377 [Marasmius tenuissimus]